jgi:hypothetical protein
MLLIVRDALDGSFVRPNQGNGVDHVYKIAGVKGRAQFEVEKIQVAIENTLKHLGFDYFKEMDAGNILVRL